MMFDLFIVPDSGRPYLASARHPRPTQALAIESARESQRLCRVHAWAPPRYAIVPAGQHTPVCFVETDGTVTKVPSDSEGAL